MQKSPQEINVEKLYLQIAEMKYDTLTKLGTVNNFLEDYLLSTFQSSSGEIDAFVQMISKNKKIAEENYKTFKDYLNKQYLNRLGKLTEMQEKYEKLSQTVKNLTAGKIKYNECNLMKKNEILSFKFEIDSLTKKIKQIQNDTTLLEKEISELKKENKNSYTTEISLLEQVMSFDKKIYAVCTERDGKIKEKSNLENELKRLNEIRKRKQEEVNEQQKLNHSNKIKMIEDNKNSCLEAYRDYLEKNKNMEQIYNAMVSFLNNLKKQNSAAKSSNDKSNQMVTPLEKSKEESNKEIHQIISNFNAKYPKYNIEINQQDPNKTLDNIMELMNDVVSKNDSKKIEVDLSKKKDLKNIKEEFNDFYDRKLKAKIFNLLKEDYIKNKNNKKKEEERLKKIKQLKEKEAELIRHLEAQKEKETQKLLEVQGLQTKNTEKKKTKNKKGKKNGIGFSSNSDSDETSEQPQPAQKAQIRPSMFDTDAKNPKVKVNHEPEFPFLNLSNLNFLEELSKNVQDVQMFQSKGFGEKKNKYSKYDFSYIK